MPEGVAKDAPKEAQSKEEVSPRHRPGNIVKVHVELLDGSMIELDVGVSTTETDENFSSIVD